MKKIWVLGVLFVLVIFLISVLPVNAYKSDTSEAKFQVHIDKPLTKEDKPAGSICCYPVISPCVWALHCKCECRRQLY